jgi:signal transduction histidine kinase
VNVRSEVGRGTTFRIELPVSGPPDAKEIKDVSTA